MHNTKEFWLQHCGKSSETIANELGGSGRTWRKRIVRAKELYPDLQWYLPVVQTTVQRGIAVFDLHYPSQDKKLWNNILNFTSDFDPDIFLFGGDNMDLEVVSHWVGNKRRKVEGMRLKQDYRGFNDKVLEPLSDVLSDGCRKIFHLGNHEDWVEQYIDCHPEVEGFFEVRNNLDLHDWEVYDYGQSSQMGKLHAIHGKYTNQHNAAKTASVYGRNIMYGHGHTFQAHTQVAPLDSQSHMAMQIPCACKMNPAYNLNQPNAWVNGFAVFYIQPDGNFNIYPVISVDGSFITPTGRHYK